MATGRRQEASCSRARPAVGLADARDAASGPESAEGDPGETRDRRYPRPCPPGCGRTPGGGGGDRVGASGVRDVRYHVVAGLGTGRAGRVGLVFCLG